MSSFGSNNPFRKRAPPNVPSSPQLALEHPTPSLFDSHLSSYSSKSGTAVQEISSPLHHKDLNISSTSLSSGEPKPAKKIPKKVQIQTPDSLSPSISEDNLSASALSDRNGSDDGSLSSPFNKDITTNRLMNAKNRMQTFETGQSNIPVNPFSKTVNDTKNETFGKEERLTISQKAPPVSMDVDAFKRLLLTGYAGASTAENAKIATVAAPKLAREIAQPNFIPSRPSYSDQDNENNQSLVRDPFPESPTSAMPQEPEDVGPLALPSKPGKKKQPPPAPASRRGKLLKLELGKEQNSLSQKSRMSMKNQDSDEIAPILHSTSSDTNKPLPPQPLLMPHDDSPFDREAAGKLPEAAEKEPHISMLQNNNSVIPTSSVVNSTQVKFSESKKPSAPAPPPTRRHTRSESKFLSTIAPTDIIQNNNPAPPSLAEDDRPPLSLASSSSVESTRSSTKGLAPTPPPPRRPNHQSRVSVATIPVLDPPAQSLPNPCRHITSPSAVSLPVPNAHGNSTSTETASIYSFSSDASPIPAHSRHSTFPLTHSRTFPMSPSSLSEPKEAEETKLSPPPPPPSRNPSARKPPSVSSFDMNIGTRRTSREGLPGPPPLPPKRGSRSRGDSRASETSVTQRESLDIQVPVLEEPVLDGEIQFHQSHTKEMLADLDSLQKEVDALRGRYAQFGQAVGSGKKELKD